MDIKQKQQLLKEVIERGFGPGVIFKNEYFYPSQKHEITITDFQPEWHRDIIDVVGVGDYDGRHTIYKNGVWAKIIHSYPQYEVY